MPDMKKEYNEKVVPALKKKLGYKNTLEVPRLTKIVIST
jgi:large subunit ribosomal protein L5